jgi:ATP-dependent Clp protease ATP-binding subunit ClpB
MTSNIGSHLIQENFEDLGEVNRDSVIERTKMEVFGLLKKTIRPELLNRIDETIMFTPLTKNDIKAIVKIQLGGLAKLLTKNNITLSYTDEAVDYIAEIGYDPQFGARPVKRVLQKNILNELSKQLLAGTVQPESDIILDQFEGQFVFRNKEAEKV